MGLSQAKKSRKYLIHKNFIGLLGIFRDSNPSDVHSAGTAGLTWLFGIAMKAQP